MNTYNASEGDWIEVNAIGRGPSRRGRIAEVLGGPGHQHYRVRWDEQHESVHFPAEGTRILHEAPDGTLVEPRKLI